MNNKLLNYSINGPTTPHDGELSGENQFFRNHIGYGTIGMKNYEGDAQRRNNFRWSIIKSPPKTTLQFGLGYDRMRVCV